MTAYGSAQTDGYTGDGLRAWKQNSNGRTYYLYDGQQAVCELNSSGTVTATNTFGVNGLVSRHSQSGSAFYDFDLSGNVAQRLTPSGSVASSDLTDGFGARQTTDTTGDPFGFSGQWGGYTDAETGLVLMTHREYDPAIGRFLTRDPAGYTGGINLYAYTGSNPINESDSSGYWNLYKWLYTGDGDAPDNVYNGALDAGCGALSDMMNCLGSKNQALLLAALGGTVPAWGVGGKGGWGPTLPGANEDSSVARVITNALLKFLRAKGYSLAESQAIADKIGIRVLAKAVSVNPKGAALSGAVRAAIIVEAILAIYCATVVSDNH